MKNRLKVLRIEKGLKQSELAKQLKVAQSTLSGWETGQNEIDLTNINRLADIFNCSIDYLLGREDVRNPYKNSNPIIAAHRTDGYDEDLPDDAKEELNNYIEFLRHKYKKE